MEMWPTRDKENLRCHWHWNPGPLNCFRVLALTRGDIIAIPVLKYSTYLQWEYTVRIPEKMSIRPNWYRMVVPWKILVRPQERGIGGCISSVEDNLVLRAWDTGDLWHIDLVKFVFWMCSSQDVKWNNCAFYDKSMKLGSSIDLQCLNRGIHEKSSKRSNL